MIADEAEVAAPQSQLRTVAATARQHQGFLLVIAAFGLTTFLVPTTAPVAISDDGMYSRSVEILLRDGELEILPLSAVTQVFQTVWGALFGLVLGDDLGVFRISTVVLTALGGWACYGLCRQLGVTRNRSALGAATYLFNPLGYVLSFSFLTDAPLTALIVIAAYALARALRSDELDLRWLAAGLAASTAALLVRQHGAIVFLSVAAHLIASGRFRLTGLRSGRDTHGIRLVAGAGAGAAIAGVALVAIVGLDALPLSDAQRYTAGRLGDLPTSGDVLRRMTFVESVYPGLFVLPVAVAALGAVPSLARQVPRARWAVVGLWGGVLLAGFVAFGDGAMPYVQSFFTVAGLGPRGDLRGGTVAVYGRDLGVVMTVACVLAMLVVLLGSLRRRMGPRAVEDERAHLVWWIIGGQALGAVVTSVNTQSFGGFSRDRYLLPLLPLVIGVALWGLREVRIFLPVAWAAVVALAAYSVIGTHDSLARQEAVWAVADDAVADGVAPTELDAGAGWASYRLYGAGVAQGQPPATAGTALKRKLLLSASDVGAWWIPFYAPEVTSEYVVTSDELDLYTTLRRVEYSSWMSPRPKYVYLVRRDDSFRN